MKKTISRLYIETEQHPQKSPDNDPLNYYFWNKIKTKVYEDGLNTPFENEEELISRMKPVWKECITKTKVIRKAIIIKTNS